MSDRIDELEARIRQLELRVQQLEQPMVLQSQPVSEKIEPAANPVNSDYAYHDTEQPERPTVGRPAPPPMMVGASGVKPVQPQQVRPVQQHRNLESFIGKNLMGILASVLVFISLVLFAILWLPRLTDGIKIAAMFLFSFALTGVSLYTLRKKENALLLSLGGCGVGSVFLSLFVTYYYFHAIPMIPLYILLFLWGVGTWFLSRRFSWLFQVIGQVGLVIALCFGMYYIQQIHDHNLFIGVMIFYVFGSAIYMFPPKQTKRMRILTYISQMATALLANELAYLYYQDVAGPLGVHRIFAYDRNLALGWAILAAYLIILVAYHIHKAAEQPTEWDFGMGFGYTLNVLFIAYIFYSDSFAWNVVCLALGVLLYVLLTLLRPEKTMITRELWRVFVVGIAFLGAEDMATYWDAVWNPTWIQYAGLFALVIMAFGLLWYGLQAQDGVSRVLGFILYLLGGSISSNSIDTDALEWTDGLYDVLWLLIPVFVYLWMHSHPETYRMRTKIATHAISMFLLLPMAARTIVAGNVWPPIIAWLLISVGNALAMKSAFSNHWVDGTKERGTWIATTVINGWMMVGGMVLAARDENTALALLAMTLGLMGIFSLNLFGITNHLPSEKLEQKLLEVYVGFKYTVLLVFLLTQVEVADYLLDVAVLIVAILFIIFGFLGQKKMLRIYGLALSILAAVKLCLVDINFDDTGARAASFLFCGVLCFAISAIYTYVDKKLKGPAQKETDN